MPTLENSSVLGRLLEELSWVGSKIRDYREGGRGYENVLTAEALQALDFLPRTHFFGKVLSKAHGAEDARNHLIREIEDANITLLPGNFLLNKGGGDLGAELAVQPDGLIESQSTFLVLEAKRIRSSSFQQEQLGREYVLALRDAGERRPILWLLLGTKPPVKVTKHGSLEPQEAIKLHLGSLLDRTQNHSISLEQAIEQIDDVVCWSTWEDLSAVIEDQLRNFSCQDTSMYSSVSRLAKSVIDAVEWHK